MVHELTVRVEIGAYVLRGREVGHVEVRQVVGDHARCIVAFTRDPGAVASPVATLQLAELAGAAVRVVLVADAGAEHLVFAGHVRAAEVDHQAGGAGEVTVHALTASHVLAEHADRRYFRAHTPAALADALGVAVAGALPAGEPRDWMQAGVSVWAFLARVAAEEGLQLRPRWPRTPDGADGEPAELGVGFAEASHALAWGRDLLRARTALAPTNAGVTGAFYEPGAKHDHRFRGVRVTPAWLGGAAPVVAAAATAATQDAGGGDPGHVEPGVPGGTRARTQAEFRARLERASAARLGRAVLLHGVSVAPGLRAGDRVTVEAPVDPLGRLRGAAATDAELTGTFGLVSVTHLWTGTLYENAFEATPWAEWHPEPTHVVDGGAPAFGGLQLALVVDVADPKGLGRVRVRHAWMGEAEHSAWLRVAGLGGGKTRGLGVLPSVGDEVLVAPVAGDPEHGVVLAGLWNGVDAPHHAPGVQSWVTPAGNALVFREGRDGGPGDIVELYTPEAKTWVQLAQRGPTGVPTVTVRSAGDLSLEAPDGELRLVAKRYTAHVSDAHATQVGGTLSLRADGAIGVATQASLGLSAANTTTVWAGGTLHTHAGGAHAHSGAPMDLDPAGGGPAPVRPVVPALASSGWAARPVPAVGRGRSTEDPLTPTREELARRAALRAAQTAPAAPADATRVANVPAALPANVIGPEPQTLAAKRARRAARAALVQDARGRAGAMPAGADRSALLATAARFEDDTRAVDRARLAQHVYAAGAGGAAPAAPLGFRQVEGAEALARYGLAPNDLAPPTSSFRAALYVDELDGRDTPVVAYRGTVFTSREDWLNNLRQGVGARSDHYERALDVAGKLADATDGRFEAAGHSLGGGMAGAVSAVHGVRADTFNAAGVSETTLARHGATRAAARATNYRVEGEVLSSVQDRDVQRGILGGAGMLVGGPLGAGAVVLGRELLGNRVVPPAVGRDVPLPPDDPARFRPWHQALNPMRAVERHGIDATIRAFEQRKGEDARALGGVDPRR